MILTFCIFFLYRLVHPHLPQWVQECSGSLHFPSQQRHPGAKLDRCNLQCPGSHLIRSSTHAVDKMGFIRHLHTYHGCVITVQNQLQRLHTEEILRQQNSLKRCMAGQEEEEEEEDESSNSTTSSPSLTHKDQQNSRYWRGHLNSNKSFIYRRTIINVISSFIFENYTPAIPFIIVFLTQFRCDWSHVSAKLKKRFKSIFNILRNDSRK